jgi:hypothetical protein
MDMSNKISGADVAPSSKRNTARDSLFLIGRLTFADIKQTYDVRIRNLSATGMMAECKAIVLPGHAVVVETKGIGEIAGKVAWAAEGRLGIAFDVQIDPSLARNPGKASNEAQTLIPDYLKKLSSKPTGFR